MKKAHPDKLLFLIDQYHKDTFLILTLIPSLCGTRASCSCCNYN